MSRPFVNRSFILLFFTIVLLVSCNTKEEKPAIDYNALPTQEKRLPENAMASMEVAAGLEMSPVASAPMSDGPANTAIDAKGRSWICEGCSYRLCTNPDTPYAKKGDRILILEDTDHDGVADTSKVFY